MKVDTVITLASGKEFLLLLEESYQNNNYFLSVLLDSNREPTNEYVVLKESDDNGKTRVTKENDPIILQQLYDDYTIQFENNYLENN